MEMANKLKRADVIEMLQRAGISIDSEATWAQLRPVYDEFLVNCCRMMKNEAEAEGKSAIQSTKEEEEEAKSKQEEKPEEQTQSVEQKIVSDEEQQISEHSVEKLKLLVKNCRLEIAKKQQEIEISSSTGRSLIEEHKSTENNGQNPQMNPEETHVQNTQQKKVSGETQTTVNVQSQQAHTLKYEAQQQQQNENWHSWYSQTLRDDEMNEARRQQQQQQVVSANTNEAKQHLNDTHTTREEQRYHQQQQTQQQQTEAQAEAKEKEKSEQQQRTHIQRIMEEQHREHIEQQRQQKIEREAQLKEAHRIFVQQQREIQRNSIQQQILSPEILELNRQLEIAQKQREVLWVKREVAQMQKALEANETNFTEADANEILSCFADVEKMFQIFGRVLKKKLTKRSQNQQQQQQVASEDSAANVQWQNEIRQVEERIKQLQSEPVISNNSSAVENRGQVAIANETEAMSNTAATRPNSSNEVNMQEVQCFNCFEFGHYNRWCTKPRRPKDACFICWELGHDRRSCPQKQSQQNYGARERNQLSDGLTSVGTLLKMQYKREAVVAAAPAAKPELTVHSTDDEKSNHEDSSKV